MKVIKLLDSYVLGEQLHLLLVSVVALLGIILSTVEVSAIFRRIAEAGMPLGTALSIMAMHLPEATIDCMPAGVLIATLLVFHRMCIESEMVALLTSGVNFYRILAIPVTAGLVLSFVSFAISEQVVPPAREVGRKLLVVGMCGSELPVPRNANCKIQADYNSAGLARVRYMFVEKFIQKYLTNVTVLVTAEGQVTSIMHAATGTWEKGHWLLKDGRVYQMAEEISKSCTAFSKLDLPGSDSIFKLLNERENNPAEFTTPKLIKYIETKGGPHAAPSLLLLLYRRYSRPFACFFIVFACAPLGLSGRRTRTLTSIAYGGAIACIYYALTSAGAGLAENGRLEPMLAAWLPNIAVAALGIAITYSKRLQYNL